MAEALYEIMQPVTPRQIQESETSTPSEGETDVDCVVESDHSASSSTPDLSTPFSTANLEFQRNTLRMIMFYDITEKGFFK